MVTILLPFLTYFYLFRTIGAKHMGAIVFTLSVIAFFRVMIKFGFEISAVRAVGRLKKDINKYISTIIIIQIFLFIVGSFILVVSGYLLGNISTQWILYLPAYLFLLAEIISIEWFFLGIERMRYLTIRIIILELTTLLLTLLFIKDPLDFIIFLFTKLFAAFLAVLYTSYVLIKEFQFKPKKINMGDAKLAINNSKSFFLSRAFAVLHEEIATILIGSYLTTKDVAYFDLARKTLSVFMIPNSVINTVAFPLLSNTKDKILGKKIFNIRNMISVTLIILLLIIAPYIVEILAPTSSPEVVNYIRIISILIFIRGIIYFTGISILVPFGYDAIFNKSVIYTVLLYLALSLLLVLLNSFSIINILIVMIASETFEAFYRYYYCKKHKLL